MRRTPNLAPFHIFLVLSVIVLAGQLAYVQFIDAAKWKAQAVNNRRRDVYTNPSRGVVYDRNGLQLVANLPEQAIAVTDADLPSTTDLYLLPCWLPTDSAARQSFYDGLAVSLARSGLGGVEIAKIVGAADPKRPYHPVLLATDLSEAVEAALTRQLVKERAGGAQTPLLLADGSERVWRQLSDLTGAATIAYIIPAELPTKGKGDDLEADQVARQKLYAELATILNNQPDAATIARLIAGRTLPIDRPIQIASNVSDMDAIEMRANAKGLPGVYIGSELQFNYRLHYQGDGLKPVVVKEGIAADLLIRVSEQSSKLPGVSIVADPLRSYSQDALYGHLLGYVGLVTADDMQNNVATINPDDLNANYVPTYENDDKAGKDGLELALEAQLRGRKGSRQVVVDSSGHITQVLTETAAVDGNNVYLTIDTKLQQKVRQYLQEQLTAAGVRTGAAVVQDVRTGAVLAMVSLPDYDNNLFATGISQRRFDELRNDLASPLINRVINPQPPGSTFKIIMAAAGLQEQVVSPSDQFFCPPAIRVPYTQDNSKFNTYRDWNTRGFGNINIVQALSQSSDVFFYQLGGPDQTDDAGNHTRWLPPGSSQLQFFRGLGIQRISSYARAFGLGAQTGIELPEESSGLVPTQEWKERTYPGDFWSLGDTLISSIGQGYMAATPLQMNNATAAIANGGILYRPTLVYQLRSGDSQTVVKDFKPEVIRQLPVSAANLALVRQGMREAVTGNSLSAYGTAWRINYKSIALAGKTGTAEYGEADANGVRKSHAWFTAFAPYDNPQIAVTVFIEGDRKLTTENNSVAVIEGSSYAVPAVGNIISYYFNLPDKPNTTK